MKSTNAIGLRFALFGVAQGSRTKLDSATIGFKATPSHNRQEAVLSPAGAGNNPPATVITAIVKSCIFLRTSGKVRVRVTRQDNSYYEQVVTAFFSLTVDADTSADAVTITVQTAEITNVNALLVWA